MSKQSVIVTGAYPCAALGDQDSALWVRRYILMPGPWVGGRRDCRERARSEENRRNPPAVISIGSKRLTCDDIAQNFARRNTNGRAIC
jgi:hypothetical protein